MKPWAQINAELRLGRERLLFSIAVWGAEVIFEPEHMSTLRRLASRDASGAGMVRAALREAGMPGPEIEDLFSSRHWKGCACWRCVVRLHAQATRSWAVNMARTEN